MAISGSDPVARPESSTPSEAAGAGAVLLGAACLSVSAILVTLAGVESATTAFLRCAIALLVLAPLALAERRRRRPISRAGMLWAIAAGVALGVDYSAWTASIYALGAGISTVVINVQVVVLPLLARVFDREPLSRRFLTTVPLMLIGISLVGGLASGSTPGSDSPVRGTLLGVLAGVAYGTYLYLARRGGRCDPGLALQPLAWATGAAALTAAALSLLSTGLDLATIDASSWAFLVALAVVGQVVAWLLIQRGSLRLAPSATGGLLLIQPVLALALSALVLGERPTALQLLGVVLVLGAVAVGTGVAAHLLRRYRPPASIAAPPSTAAGRSRDGPRRRR